MTRFLVSLLVLLTLPAQAATQWYITKEATGSNAGTSWANAWTNVNALVWSSLATLGTNEVSLWVTNSAGAYASYTNQYRVLGVAAGGATNTSTFYIGTLRIR